MTGKIVPASANESLAFFDAGRASSSRPRRFAIVDRPDAARHIDWVSRQVDMSDEAGSVVAEHLGDVRNELLASEASYE
ncbi:hypothetical protein [Bradyrhizobium valentinum]|uniref:hypothetical protein n=1 Tax=Bradyrhizobium valentinum TaxID=1518501 RepID=UPI000709E15D|nr:hypothetical protein [Bradyrhizobium valentinum]